MTWYCNPAAREWTDLRAHTDARDFHHSLPGYAPTPLVDLPDLAAELGVGRVLVKDESARFGLGAFKVLGASWACRQVIEQHHGAEFVTATDGNHGRAVAHMARRLGTTATVFVPQVMAPDAEARIAAEGARVVRVDGVYDEAVEAAARYVAEAAGADRVGRSGTPARALVQDTAWPGYTQIPAWIVDGYRTLLAEVDEQLGRVPDVIVVPSGVGSVTQAVVEYHRRAAAPHPSVLSVEPDTAACVLASLRAGEPVTVETADTVMAGLNCGTVSDLAWPVLRGGCDAAVAVDDAAALAAARDLAALGVSSGPSGSASLAGIRAVQHRPDRRVEFALAPDAVVVLLNTEGAHGDA